MNRALAALIVVFAFGCGSTTTGLGAPLTVPQLKFTVIDSVGPPAFCDPDFYPIGRPGGEQEHASAAYAQIRADAALYSAITAHEHLPAGELDDAQKLALYRAFKLLRALPMTSAGDGYSFSYTVDRSFTKVTGSVRSDGMVTVESRVEGSRPPCPICLAASTTIATPTGPVLVTRVVPGMLVWTLTADGRRVAEPVLETGSTQVPPGHLMVHLRLADGRELWASPGHRTADGRQLGRLATGDLVDGSRVVLWELIPYAGERTYDLLPAGATGVYWADGIPLSSTLRVS